MRPACILSAKDDKFLMLVPRFLSFKDIKVPEFLKYQVLARHKNALFIALTISLKTEVH